MLIRWVLVMLLFLPGQAFAWQSATVNGRVTDGITGIAVPGASVYISNSTFGTECDQAGNFAFTYTPGFPFDLNISALGYETRVLRITGPQAARNITLQPRPQHLDEVTVIPPEKDGWQKYGTLFLREFIGYSAFARQCTLLNKEVLEFRFNAATGILTVWANGPLRIRNKATGYDITYWLDDFELHQFEHLLYFKGSSRFIPLTQGNRKKIQQYEDNRLAAYQGSLQHFMRSLFSGNIAEQGFEVRTLIRVTAAEAEAYLPQRTDTLYRSDTGKVRALFREIMMAQRDTLRMIHTLSSLSTWWKNDTLTAAWQMIQPDSADTARRNGYVLNKDSTDRERILVSYYAFPAGSRTDLMNLPVSLTAPLTVKGVDLKGLPHLKRRSMDFLYRPLLQRDSMISKDTAGHIRLAFRDYLHVTYLHEKEEPEYLQQQFPFKKMLPGDEKSILSLKDRHGVVITADGNFIDAYNLLKEQYWSYEKLDKLLPLDYTPALR